MADSFGLHAQAVSEDPHAFVTDPADCGTCQEDPQHVEFPLNECPNSRRPCGHHCNCSWIHDCCHWCGGEYDDDGQTWLTADEVRRRRDEA